MSGGPEDPNLERLRALQTLPEHVFSSPVPLFGPLIARFRDLWNSIATKWYVSPLIRQQSEFNRLAVDRFEVQTVDLTGQATGLANHEAWLKDLAGRLDFHTRRLDSHTARLDELDARLIDQDREQSALTHDLGEAAALLVQLNRLLDSLDRRVASLEEGAGLNRERA